MLVLVDLTILTIYTTVEGARDNLEADREPNRENRRDMKGVSVY